MWIAEDEQLQNGKFELQGGKYVLKARIGSTGGYGCLFKAWQKDLEGYVVVKMAHPSLDEDLLKVFSEEGKNLQRLSERLHPNIVRVRDFFKEDKTPCIVMDYIDGKDLKQLIEEKGALPEGQARIYIYQISEALKTVHSAGLIHRDIKPANIMITSDNKAFLVDFGISIEHGTLTQNLSASVGTPQYTPLDQDGKSKEVTMDVYALAATFYHALTGQPPKTYADRCNYEGLTPPKSLAPHISDYVNEAIVKGLELKPEKRPQSMDEWIRLIEGLPASFVTTSALMANQEVDPLKLLFLMYNAAFKSGNFDKVLEYQDEQQNTSSLRKQLFLAVILSIIFAIGGSLYLCWDIIQESPGWYRTRKIELSWKWQLLVAEVRKGPSNWYAKRKAYLPWVWRIGLGIAFIVSGWIVIKFKLLGFPT